MLISGAMSHISQVIIEWHPNLAGDAHRREQSNVLEKSIETIGNITRYFSVITVDDETYRHDENKLPTC